MPRPANDPAPVTGPRALLPLAFDHARIVADGPDRARAKIEYTPSAPAFLVEEFTIADLRGIYASIWGSPLHTGNFHRKVRSVTGCVESTGATVARGGARGRAAPHARAAARTAPAAARRPTALFPADPTEAARTYRTLRSGESETSPRARAHTTLHPPSFPRQGEREPACTKETGRFGDNAPFTREGYRIAAAWPGASPCN